MKHLTLVGLLIVCGACAVPDEPHPISRVILSNDAASTVKVAKDKAALLAAFRFATNEDAQSRAQEEAMEVDGRLFSVPNGTRADVIQEGDPIVAGVKPLTVRLTSGQHAGETVICFNTVTQPDR